MKYNYYNSNLSKKKIIFFTINQLINSHFHLNVNLKRKKLWNPNLKSFILKISNNIPILDLKLILILYKRSLLFLKKIIFKNGIIIICHDLHTIAKKDKKLISLEQQLNKEYNCYIIHKWFPGMLSSLNTFRKRNSLTNTKLLTQIKYLPDVCIMNYKEEIATHLIKKENKSKNMIKEAIALNIPTITLLDTSYYLDKISYPILGNTTSISSKTLFYNIFFKSILLNKLILKKIFLKNK